MSIISKIRSHFFETHLNQKLAQLKITRPAVSFSEAKSIGILFDATDAGNRNKVMAYAQSLIEKGKKVNLLGFVKNKQKDLSLPFKFFTLQNVNWKMIPEGEEVNQFLNKKFEILINLYLGDNNQIEYISALSKANLRVGPFTDNTNCYDLIIDTPTRTDIDNLIKQINFFLNRINTPIYETAV